MPEKRKPTAENAEDRAEQAMTDGNGVGQEEVADVATGVEEGSEQAERLAQLEADLAEMKSRYLRSLADMENVRRRARLDVEEAHRFGTDRLMTDLLPVLDNMARALDAADTAADLEAWKQGVEATRRQLAEALERHGLKKLESVGQDFDPNRHEAILQVEAGEGQRPHEVVEELRSGYTLNDRVLRPSLVKVVSG
jgi:molecular chaperone GrpE